MRNKQELLNDLDEQFKTLKKELRLKYSLEDFDSIFFIRDLISSQGFVSENLSRVICRRIAENYGYWANDLCGLIIPNPNSLISMSESQAFDKKDREEITLIVNKAMVFVSANPLIGLTKDKKAEAKFMNDAVSMWHEFFRAKLVEISIKANRYWIGKSK